MKPDFALSLSFDGITLLRRVTGGWSTVGEVALDTEDMSGALHDLRKKADALSPKGGQVKLVVPNEQIKYLSLSAPRKEAALRQAIEAALAGATPYAVADLVYDWTRKGDTLLVAAVARDTLDEAQEFTQSHHFEPVSFVAVAPSGKFDGEVFFGPAPSWSGPVPERDKAAVKRVAPEAAPEPTTQSAPEAAPESGPEIAPEIAPETKGAEDTPRNDAAQPGAEVARPPAPGSDPGAAPDPASDSRTEPPPDPVAAPKPAPLTASKPEAAGKGNAPGIAAPDIGKPDAAPPAFSSIRASRDAPAAGQAARVAPHGSDAGRARITPQPGGETAPTDQTGSDDPAQAAPRQDAPEPADARGPTANPAAQPIPPRLAAIKAAGRAPVPPAEPPADLAESLSRDALDTQDAAAEAVQRAPASQRSEPAQEAPRRGKFKFGKRRAAATPAKAPAPTAGATAGATAGSTAAAVDERDRMTIFGARQGNDRIGGKPRFLGLILTTALLLFLAAMAAWASVFLDDGLARFFRPDVSPSVAVTTSPLPEPSIADEVAADAPEEMAALDPGQDITSDLPVDAAPAPIERPRALTPQEAEATYAATGIWQRAPSAPMEPQQSALGDLYVASIDRDVQQFDAVALPAAAPAATATVPGFAAPPNPAPAGVTFDLDARGLVRAVPEGAMNPDGVLVYTGLPPAVPPLRGAAPPETPEDTPESRAIQDRIERLRPALRPDDIVERNERATLAGRSLAELAILRPAARPEAAKRADEVDISATDLAIVASPKPLPRPRDIERIVAEARARTPEPEPSVQVASAASVASVAAPRIPSNASVSTQATVRNAINLRRINLIGVYGKPSNRRALVRLSNGRYQKVEVGDRIDGGRVAAIDTTQLRYIKGGRNIVLEMPDG